MTAALGESEFAARIVSFIAAILSIPLIFTLGRLLDRPATGLWAALMLALSPFHVTYAQEARHYSLLMMFTLSSFVALYLALRYDRLSSWLLYAMLAVLSIYTHYGALLVLLAQAVLVVIWLVLRRAGAIMAAGKHAAFAAIFIALLYLPWLPRLGGALSHNVGSQVVTGTGVVTPIDQWMRRGFAAFGMYDNRVALLLLLLVLVGAVTLAIRREWLSLLFVTTGIVIPLLLIGIVPIGRGALPRYIIYVLPPYLLSAAIGLEWLLLHLARQTSRLPRMAGAAAMVTLLLIVGWGAIRGVYEHVEEDWKSILAYLDEETSGEAVLLALSQNSRAGFNLAAASLPYYLEKSDRNYQFLPGNRLSLDKASTLAGKGADVWAIVVDWQQPTSLQSDNLAIRAVDTARARAAASLPDAQGCGHFASGQWSLRRRRERSSVDERTLW
jgi:4-amino-4-deoxy-L-arabinose transferase-like glycosyltransferase